jgi:hypothetical protein
LWFIFFCHWANQRRGKQSLFERNKFCEDLIAYFPLIVICVFDATSRKKA